MEHYKIEYLKLPYSLKNKIDFIDWFNKKSLVEQFYYIKINSDTESIKNITNLRLQPNDVDWNNSFNLEIEYIDSLTNQKDFQFFLIPIVEYIVNLKPFNFENISFINLMRQIHYLNLFQITQELNLDLKYSNDYVFRSIELYWSNQPNQICLIFRLSRPYVFPDGSLTKIYTYNLSEQQKQIKINKIKINLNNFYHSFHADKFITFFNSSFNLKEKFEKLGITSDEFILNIKDIKVSPNKENNRKLDFNIELYDNYCIEDEDKELVNNYQITSGQFLDENTTYYISFFETKILDKLSVENTQEDLLDFFEKASLRQKIDFLQLEPIELQHVISDITYAKNQDNENAIRLIIFLNPPFKFTTGNKFQFLDIKKFNKNKSFVDLDHIYLNDNYYSEYSIRSFVHHFLFKLDLKQRMELLNINDSLINDIENILVYLHGETKVRFEIEFKDNCFFVNSNEQTINFISNKFLGEDIFENIYVPKINIAKKYYLGNSKSFILDFWKENDLIKKLELLGITNLKFASRISKIFLEAQKEDFIKIELFFKDEKSLIFTSDQFRQKEILPFDISHIQLKDKYYNASFNSFYHYFNSLDIKEKINCFDVESEKLLEQIEFIIPHLDIFSFESKINFYFKLKDEYKFSNNSWIYKYTSNQFTSDKIKLPSFNIGISNFLYSQNVNVVIDYLNRLQISEQLHALSLNTNDIFSQSIQKIDFKPDNEEPNKIVIILMASSNFSFSNFENTIELKTSYFLPNLNNLPVFRTSVPSIDQTIEAFEEEFNMATLEKQKYMLNIQYQEFSKFIKSMNIERNNSKELFINIRLFEGNSFEFVGPITKQRISDFIQPLSFAYISPNRIDKMTKSIRNKINVCDSDLFQQFSNYDEQLKLIDFKDKKIEKQISNISLNCINNKQMQVVVFLKPNILFVNNFESRMSLDIDIQEQKNLE